MLKKEWICLVTHLSVHKNVKKSFYKNNFLMFSKISKQILFCKFKKVIVIFWNPKIPYYVCDYHNHFVKENISM